MVAIAAENRIGAPNPAVPDMLSLKPKIGYCADCGTWDAHGRFCTACGYDFAPEPERDMAEPRFDAG